MSVSAGQQLELAKRRFLRTPAQAIQRNRTRQKDPGSSSDSKQDSQSMKLIASVSSLSNWSRLNAVESYNTLSSSQRGHHLVPIDVQSTRNSRNSSSSSMPTIQNEKSKSCHVAPLQHSGVLHGVSAILNTSDPLGTAQSTPSQAAKKNYQNKFHRSSEVAGSMVYANAARAVTAYVDASVGRLMRNGTVDNDGQQIQRPASQKNDEMTQKSLDLSSSTRKASTQPPLYSSHSNDLHDTNEDDREDECLDDMTEESQIVASLAEVRAQRTEVAMLTAELILQHCARQPYHFTDLFLQPTSGTDEQGAKTEYVGSQMVEYLIEAATATCNSIRANSSAECFRWLPQAPDGNSIRRIASADRKRKLEAHRRSVHDSQVAHLAAAHRLCASTILKQHDVQDQHGTVATPSVLETMRCQVMLSYIMQAAAYADPTGASKTSLSGSFYSSSSLHSAPGDSNEIKTAGTRADKIVRAKSSSSLHLKDDKARRTRSAFIGSRSSDLVPVVSIESAKMNDRSRGIMRTNQSNRIGKHDDNTRDNSYQSLSTPSSRSNNISSSSHSSHHSQVSFVEPLPDPRVRDSQPISPVHNKQIISLNESAAPQHKADEPVTIKATRNFASGVMDPDKSSGSSASSSEKNVRLKQSSQQLQGSVSKSYSPPLSSDDGSCLETSDEKVNSSEMEAHPVDPQVRLSGGGITRAFENRPGSSRSRSSTGSDLSSSHHRSKSQHDNDDNRSAPVVGDAQQPSPNESSPQKIPNTISGIVKLFNVSEADLRTVNPSIRKYSKDAILPKGLQIRLPTKKEKPSSFCGLFK